MVLGFVAWVVWCLGGGFGWWLVVGGWMCFGWFVGGGVWWLDLIISAWALCGLAVYVGNILLGWVFGGFGGGCVWFRGWLLVVSGFAAGFVW